MDGLMNWAANNEYTFMWYVYYLGSAGLLLVLWRLIRRWSPWFKLPLLAVAFAILFVSSLVNEEQALSAPALAVAPLKWLSGGAEAAAPALTAMAGWSLLALLLVLAVLAALRWRAASGSRPADPAGHSSNPAIKSSSETGPSAEAASH